MNLPPTGQILRVYIGESDRFHHQPLYEAIVLKAREIGLAGATVFRGAMGFGASSHLHTAKILRLSMDLPVLIEIIDSAEKIAGFLPFLDEVVKDGLVTIEEVRIVKYHGGVAKT
jgi:PII-like signaling protein